MEESNKQIEKKCIKFEELEKYIGKPVYNNEQKKWKILKGYARIEDKYMLMYTESDWMRNGLEWEPYNETLLSICE